MGARAHAMSQKSTTRPQTLSNQQRYRNIACGRRLYLDAFRPRFDHVSTTNRPSTDHNRPSFDHQLTTKRLFRQEKNTVIRACLISTAWPFSWVHQSHFCTAFKCQYGVSPSLFRDQQNKVIASAPASRLEVYDDVGWEV